ncbi:phage protein [Streptococcus varani]|uniref:Phage protein n=2 Tax=Streptococcus varani TaxID=1608583 RepID=A0A0E3WFP5_9STRE|nr:phage protein [Streptococcus varani]
MKQKRKEEREEKVKVPNANKKPQNRPKKIKNLVQHYKKMKKDILANEKEFGFVGRYIIEGVEVHEENFEQLVTEKIKERKEE